MLGKSFTIPFRCPTCSKQEQKQHEEQQARLRLIRERNLAAERERQRSVRIEAACLPLRHRGKGFDGFDASTSAQKHALSVTRRYAEAIAGGTEPKGHSLLLVGKPGTGKTHLAVSIAETVLDAAQDVCYVTASELARRVMATYSRRGEETAADVFDGAANVRLLIIDELGSTQLSDHERKILFEAIDTRYRECRPLVACSNLPLGVELASALGERIVDRLREITSVVAFDWRSHR